MRTGFVLASSELGRACEGEQLEPRQGPTASMSLANARMAASTASLSRSRKTSWRYSIVAVSRSRRWK
jgi:hypothetical protein